MTAPHTAGDGALRWELRRNCALAPRQLLAGCGALALLLLAIGAVFWSAGYGWVALFSLLEVAALAAAVLAYARHATDRETLVVRDGRLEIEQHAGSRCRRLALPVAWTRVEAPAAPHGLVALQVPGVLSVQVGCHLSASARPVLAAQLREALRRAPR